MKPELIVAIDVDTLAHAQELVDCLTPDVSFFKIGSVLFTRHGKEILEYIQEKNARVFLDLKFHDIPNTVKQAVASGAMLGVDMMTVHTQGGRAMLEAAVSGAQTMPGAHNKKPLVVGVTVLTSEQFDNLEAEVVKRAKRAHTAGLDGVVCSVWEAAKVRKACGKNFTIITPGIRPAGAPGDDQKRVATIDDARKAGVDYIVVGRPIIAASDPRVAAQQFIA